MDQLVGLYGHGNGIVSFRFKNQINHHYIPKKFETYYPPINGFRRWMKSEYNAKCTIDDENYIRIKFVNDGDLVLFLLKYR